MRPAKEEWMNEQSKLIFTFITGLAIGAGVALLFAPQSGEDTREWIAESVEDEAYRLKRKARRSLDEVQDALERGEQKVAKVLKTGKTALDTLAAKLD
jgi:gas vesicle protein